MKILAVDGDTLAYRTAAVCNDHFEGAAEAIIDTTLRNIATDTNIPDMRIYISGEKCFRYDIARTKPYKGNRATMVKPIYLNSTKDYLVRKYGAVRCDGYEADDAIATDMVKNGAIHCGVDKDMLQIEGQHYNYVKNEWINVSEAEAVLLLYRQILMGDASDNVAGLPRIGEKKAADAIQNWKTAQEDALEFYRVICEERMPDVNYLEYFMEQSALITMIRDIPLHCIDFNTFTTIEVNTEGFDAQEGEEIESFIPKRSLKL